MSDQLQLCSYKELVLGLDIVMNHWANNMEIDNLHDGPSTSCSELESEARMLAPLVLLLSFHFISFHAMPVEIQKCGQLNLLSEMTAIQI